jgi:hypothetical protein
LGGCTLSGGCVHVLKSTLKAPFRCKAGGLRTTQTRLEDRTRRGVERCGGLASIGNIRSPWKARTVNYIQCPRRRHFSAAEDVTASQQKEFDRNVCGNSSRLWHCRRGLQQSRGLLPFWKDHASDLYSPGSYSMTLPGLSTACCIRPWPSLQSTTAIY